MDIKNNMSEKERFDLVYSEILSDGKIMYAGRILQKGYERFPENIALIYKDREVSYKELYYRACIFSKKLSQLGVKPGDKVLLFFRNSLEIYVAYFAVWHLGAVVGPLNIFLSEKELAHILYDSQANMVITSSDKVDFFKGSDIAKVVTEKDMDLDSPMPDILPHFEIKDLDEEDLVALLYTSGTTGLPKGVMLSSKNIMTNVAQIMARMPFSKSLRIFCVLPLFHCFAQNTCIWSSLFTGCTVVVVPKVSRKEIFDGLKHKPNIFLGVPALFGLMCLMRSAPLDCVDYFICGGDALPDKIRAGFSLVYRRKICNGYGLTETSPLISVDLDDIAGPTNNVGKPVQNIKCILRNEDGNVLPQGKIGELWVKGDNVMMGYYNAPEKTKNVIVNGWFCTGDLARFDEDGKLIICGRLKDLIIHKGMNIYPQEIENVIVGHKDILRVGVIGEYDDLHDQVPIAIVQLGRKNKGIEKELRNLCKKELAAYKVPRRFIIVKDMPLTATSKVDKKKLREQIGRL